MNWLDAIVDFGLVTGSLEESDRELIRGCFVTRGPRKGLILASAPSGRTDPRRAAAWQALISAIAPARLGFGTLFFMPAEARAVFNRIEAWSSIRTVVRALNDYAQRPCEFNLHHYHVDPMPADNFASKVRAGIERYLANRPAETATPEDFAR